MANKLIYKSTKNISIDNYPARMTVTVSLDDECKNGHCDFSITAMIYQNGECVGGGCCHEEIAKYFPELRIFIPLHLSSHEGTPMYPVANGIWWMRKGNNKRNAMELLRIDETEYRQLCAIADDEKYFKYMLFKLGIVKRWKEQANAAIKKLEELTGEHWENPYTPEEERFRLKPLSPEEIEEIEKREKGLYYSPEKIEERKIEAKKESVKSEINQVIGRYEKQVKKLTIEKDICLAVLEAGISVNNMIYYESSNTIVFNWKEYEDKVSREELERLLREVDYTKLPEGIKITMK